MRPAPILPLRRILFAETHRRTAATLSGAMRVPPVTPTTTTTTTLTPPPPPLTTPLSTPPRRWQHHGDDRTIVKVLNMESDAGLMVDAYSQVGFRLNNGLSIVGSVALFPKTVLSWGVTTSAEINEDTLSLFYMLEPKIDILILGIGSKGSAVNPNIIQFMKRKGINVEIMPTESACTTFNFLNMERRYIAAALIPPSALMTTQDDLVAAQRDSETLFTDRSDY